MHTTDYTNPSGFRTQYNLRQLNHLLRGTDKRPASPCQYFNTINCVTTLTNKHHYYSVKLHSLTQSHDIPTRFEVFNTLLVRASEHMATRTMRSHAARKGHSASRLRATNGKQRIFNSSYTNTLPGIVL